MRFSPRFVPSRDSSASAGWARDVTVARPDSRGVHVSFRGRPSVRVAPSWLQALPSCPFPSRVQASGSSATGPPPRACARKGPSLGARLPFRVRPGCTARAAFAVFALTGSRRRSGPPLLRFLVPTTRCLRVPRSATTGSTGRRRRGIPLPRPVPSSGFLNPSTVSAATARRARVAPNPPFRRRYAPKLRGLVTCRKRPWDSPSRAFPSRGAVPPRRWALLPCGFDVDRTSGAKVPRLSDRFPPHSALLPRPEPPVRRTSRADMRAGVWLPRDRRDHLSTPRVAP